MDYTIHVQGIPVDVTRKNIKNLYLSVHPPDGQVRVSAPISLSEGEVRLSIMSKLGWVERKQTEFAKQVRQSQREMVTGESHYVWGRRYSLDIVEQNAPPSITIRNDKILKMVVTIHQEAFS
ncbi:MAG: DUF45 domain-containing protein [Anaerolineales bacterium]|nr:MAG: DUF45 domain-containing protein [Anaerolineales bacterium]